MIGKKISHYEITERLGAGGMGVVYKAVDPRLERTVAIKFLGASLSGDSVAKQRFIQEAKSASALDHPNICSIYEIDEDPDGNLFMVMAHYKGKPLDDVIDDGPVTVGEALGITVQVADGLAKAHSRGIFHRDIKPANVMLTEDGIAKILDFGLAKMHGATSLTQSGQSVGTPAYMAPENMTEGTVDHRADIWAVGVMLYELMTGTRPFAADHPQAVMYQVVNEDPKPLSDVFPEAPAGVWEVIEKCLRKEPEERYQQVAEIRDDLRLILKRLEASSDASLSSQNAYASSVNVALRMKPARTTNYGKILGRVVAVVGVAAVVAGAVYGGMKLFEPESGEALRVLVMPTEVRATETTSGQEQAASAVDIALIRGFNGMDGAVPVDPPRGADLQSIAELAGAAAADDVIQATLMDAGAEWQVTLKCLRADGSVQWANDFSAPQDDAHSLAKATLLYLSQGYSQFDVPDEIDVRPEDYATYVRLHERFLRERGNEDAALLMLDSLQAVSRTSPRFAEAYLLEASICRILFDSKREAEYLERAKRAAGDAKAYAPQDPRALERLFDIAIREGDLAAAKAASAEISDLQPGSAEQLRRDALIAEKEGEVEQALALLREAVRRRPARTFLIQLANLEYDHGYHAEARVNLEALLERFPNHNYSRSKLAELELLYGDAERARELYAAMVAESPGSVEVTNLGLALELLGRYEEAVESFERAVEMAPSDPTGYLNLADCSKMAGDTNAADSLYSHVLALIAKDPNPDDTFNLQMRAQSLAHIGQHREAVSIIQEALKKDDESAWSCYAAALVLTVVSEPISAISYAEKAAAKGVGGRWFQLGFFEPLRDDPAFVAILAGDPITSP